MTEIAKIDASAAIMSVNNSLVCAGMEKYQKNKKMKYLVPLAKGDNRCILFVRARSRKWCNFSKNDSNW
jgi:hypothetical protein